MLRKIILGLTMLVAPTLAGAQSFRKDDVVTNQAGTPLPGANIYICTGIVIPSTTATPPCTLAPIYKDVALSQPQTNPISAGPLGNYGFFAVPGNYTGVVRGPRITQFAYTLTLPCTPTSFCGGGGGGGSPNAVLNNQSNTYTTGTQDFTLATNLVLPHGPGFFPSTFGIGVDSTTGALIEPGGGFGQIWAVGVQPGVPGVTNNCAKWVAGTTLADAGAPCATVAGSANQFIANLAGTAFAGTPGFIYDFTNNVPSVVAGTKTTDVNPLAISEALNNVAQVFNGWKVTIQAIATANGSMAWQLCTGPSGTTCVTIDVAGNMAVPKILTVGDPSVAGSLQLAQGPIPGILANNVGWTAPASVVVGGFLISMPGAPCSGQAIITASGNRGVMSCGGAAGNSLRQTGVVASLTNLQLCAAAACPAGEYEVKLHVNSTVACATPGIAGVRPQLTWTDDAGTKAGKYFQLDTYDTSIDILMAAVQPLGTTTGYGFGNFIIWTTGVNDILFSTQYAACTSGTGTYSYSAEVVRLQ